MESGELEGGRGCGGGREALRVGNRTRPKYFLFAGADPINDLYLFLPAMPLILVKGFLAYFFFLP